MCACATLADVPRRMANPEFRRSQEMGIRLPHVAPINALVDELRSSSHDKKWMPYVAPLHGGIDARMVNILRDPGPMTHSGMAGSDFSASRTTIRRQSDSSIS